MSKAPDAFRTISEVAEDLDLPQHVLRFWETRFSQIRPMKRGGGRRYYRPDDVNLLRGIRHLLYGEGYTIKGVQRILKEQGVRSVATNWASSDEQTQDQPSSPVEVAREAHESKVAPEEAVVAAREVHQASQINELAASFETPEAIAAPAMAPKDAPKPEPVVQKVAEEKVIFKAPDTEMAPEAMETAGAPFALAHTIPAHLVDAITSGPSMVEMAPIDGGANGKENMADPLPADILPDDEEVTGKSIGRGLLERITGGDGQDSAKKRGSGMQLAGGELEKLQATLVDLLECKRLLDQIR